MGYIIGNIDKKEYLRPDAFGEGDTLLDIVDSYEGVMLALVVLLADSNNRGGGDLRSNHAIIGTWAGDRIAIIDDAAELFGIEAPGFDEGPLQPQFLAQGTDVSGAAIEAILDGEGSYSRLSQLNPRHVLSLQEQTKLQENSGAALLTRKGRATTLSTTDDLFGVLGEPLVLTTEGRRKALEKGINTMAFKLGRPERYWVKTYSATVEGKKVRIHGMTSDSQHAKLVYGDRDIECLLVDPAGAEKQLNIRLGVDDGTTVNALYEALFPGIQFERMLNALDVKPEYAALLAYSQDKGE